MGVVGSSLELVPSEGPCDGEHRLEGGDSGYGGEGRKWGGLVEAEFSRPWQQMGHDPGGDPEHEF